jgi:hypothetical protein
MVSLHFLQGVSGRDAIVLGPAPWFRLTASYIREGPHGTIAGSYRGILWEVAGQYYKTLECRAPVTVCFEDASGKHSGKLGPFAYLRVSEGLMSIESGLLASFNEENRRWIDVSTGGIWPDVLILSA